MFINNQKNVLTIKRSANQEICKEVNAAGTDENLFRLVPVLGHGARVVPLELVPVLGHGARVVPLELVPVLGHGARVVPLVLVPVLGHGARVVPLVLVPVLGHGARVVPLVLVPVPRHGAQICARHQQKSERGHSLWASTDAKTSFGALTDRDSSPFKD